MKKTTFSLPTDKTTRLSSQSQSLSFSDSLLPRLAHHVAMQGPPRTVGYNVFYELPSGWAVEKLAAEAAVHVVDTPEGLEVAFSDMSVCTILIRSGSRIGQDTVVRLCERQGQKKTIFFEVDNNG